MFKQDPAAGHYRKNAGTALRQLVADNLVSKTIEQIKPPITIYNLAPAGEELVPILMAMADWAIKDSKQYDNLKVQMQAE